MGFTKISRFSTCPYAIGDLTADTQPQMLQEHSKRKSNFDSPDDFLTSRSKRRTLTRLYAISDLAADPQPHMLQERSKRKSNFDTPDDFLTPRLKRRTLTRSYAISDLAADPQPQMLQERSKRKSNFDTPDDFLTPRLKRRTLTRSYAISDLAADPQPHMLQECSKRKSNFDSPDDFLTPRLKRRTLTRSYETPDLTADPQPHMLQERSKRKSKLDTPNSLPSGFKQRTLTADSRPKLLQQRLQRQSVSSAALGSLPPDFKRCTLTCPYAISDYTAQTRPTEYNADPPPLHVSLPADFTGRGIRISCWPLPNELILMIFEQLPVTDLRTVTQVCRLSRDVAASLYFHLIGLHVEQMWLRVNAQGCLALPLYARTNFFCIPRILRCDFLGIGDHNLTALKVFLEALRGSKPISSVICFDAPPEADLASLFHLVKDLGCSSFRYSSIQAEHPSTMVPDLVPESDPSEVCNLRRFSVDSPTFFSSSVAQLTLTTLRDSPITDLSLTHVALSSIQWTALLRNVHLPLLHMLSVDVECPPAALGDFLARHPNIGQVWILPGYTPTPPANDSSHQLRGIPDHHLQNLGVLGGSPGYLLALLAKVHPAHSIQHLSVRFEDDSTPFNTNYLSTILDITQHFTSIQELQLNFYGDDHPAGRFEVLVNECRTMTVNNLAISTHCKDDIFISPS
ncbi:hypothetical protein C8R48DRAFT_780736 [Suillus tomentosus]|nr:hypothetical protein C8R48DRAFT_780736 [Suillus tomentosus]